MHDATFLGLAVMLHGESPRWWMLYFVANWATAAAYFAIPIRMAIQRRAGERQAESVLFELFVSACGFHHLLMPLGMLFGFMNPLLVIDAVMATISVFSAREITRPRKPTPELAS